MQVTAKKNEQVAKMTFATVYPHYVNKVESKGRTKDELQEVIQWLTGYDASTLQELIQQEVTFESFFKKSGPQPKYPSNKRRNLRL